MDSAHIHRIAIIGRAFELLRFLLTLSSQEARGASSSKEGPVPLGKQARCNVS